MKLGGALRRRRSGGGGEGRRRPASGSRKAGWSLRSATPWLRLLPAVAGLALAGSLGGYLLATRAFFPAPPPPVDLVAVPDLQGVGIEAAQRRLEAAGLVLGPVDSVSHPSMAEGLILGQSPLPGQLALPGAEVRVVRALAAQAQTVPDVRRLEASRARVVLEAAGFVVAEDSVDSDIPRGRVVGTAPPADAAAAIPSVVRLAVSRGPPLVPMPYLVGMGEGEAMAVLDSLGLVLGEVEEVTDPSGEGGRVLGQEPAAETPLERGSAVRLAVGRRQGYP